jgi:PE family
MAMTLLIASPESMTDAAAQLATLGAMIDAAHAMAARATTAIAPAAADTVSVGIADHFSDHGMDWQAIAGRAAAFHEQFTNNLAAGSAAYVETESANVIDSVGVALTAPLVLAFFAFLRLYYFALGVPFPSEF